MAPLLAPARVRRPWARWHWQSPGSQRARRGRHLLRRRRLATWRPPCARPPFRGASTVWLYPPSCLRSPPLLLSSRFVLVCFFFLIFLPLPLSPRDCPQFFEINDEAAVLVEQPPATPAPPAPSPDGATATAVALAVASTVPALTPSPPLPPTTTTAVAAATPLGPDAVGDATASLAPISLRTESGSRRSPRARSPPVDSDAQSPLWLLTRPVSLSAAPRAERRHAIRLVGMTLPSVSACPLFYFGEGRRGGGMQAR